MSFRRLIPASLCMLLLVTGCYRPTTELDFERILHDQIEQERAVMAKLREQTNPQNELVFAQFRDALVLDDETMFLALEHAVALAMMNNMGIKIAEVGPEIAMQAHSAAYGTFDPTVFTELAWNDQRLPQPSALFGTQLSKQSTFNGSAGISKLWSTGTVTTLSYGQERLASNSPVFNPNPYWQANESLSITQPLLRNGWSDVVTAEIRSTRIAIEQSRHELDSTKIEILAGVKRAYWQLVFAVEDLRVKRESLKLAEQLLELQRKKLNAGVIPEIELVRAESEVAQRKDAVIRAETAIRNAQDRLRLLIEPQQMLIKDLELVPTERPSFVYPTVTYTDSLKAGLMNRPDLRSLRKQIELQDVALVVAHNRKLPVLDLEGTYSANGLDTNPWGATDRAGSLDRYQWSANVRFEYPLGNNTARHNFLREKLTKQQLVLQLQDLEYRIIEEVKVAYRNMVTAAKRIDANREAVRLARAQLQFVSQRYEAGTAILLDVVQAQRDLTDAEVALNSAVIDYRLSLINLAEAMGVVQDPVLDPALTARPADPDDPMYIPELDPDRKDRPETDKPELPKSVPDETPGN